MRDPGSFAQPSPCGTAQVISHEHRCIFVHIPRTAGSSIEEWICGEDWWNRDPSTKHLTAHRARTLYAEYWDDYFTFSFVRDPWERMLSCLHFGPHFGVVLDGGRLDFTGYDERFGSPITLEIDYRFHDRIDLLRPVHRPGAVYGNLLDEELDFVGRFESLERDTTYIADRLGIGASFSSTLKQSSSRPAAEELYDERADRWIRSAFAEDLRRFGYGRPLPV